MTIHHLAQQPTPYSSASTSLRSSGRSWRKDLPTYSPTSLNQHATCPESFLHERVLKSPPTPIQVNAGAAKGSATHALLERYVTLDPASRALFAGRLSDAAARALTTEGLRAESSPEHAQLVADVVEWTTTGITMLEAKLADATLVVGEQFLDLRWEVGPFPFRLMAKVDLLVAYPDGALESLDWKTGGCAVRITYKMSSAGS